VLVLVRRKTKLELAESRTPSSPRAEAEQRSRVLLLLVAFSFLYVLGRYTFMADLNHPPHRWKDRAAWWLPSGS
jgi:hypothetical protein